MLRLLTFAISVVGVIAYLYGASWGGIVAFAAAVWFVAGLMHSIAFDRTMRRLAGVKKWPGEVEIARRKRSRANRESERGLDSGLNGERK